MKAKRSDAFSEVTTECCNQRNVKEEMEVDQSICFMQLANCFETFLKFLFFIVLSPSFRKPRKSLL